MLGPHTGSMSTSSGPPLGLLRTVAPTPLHGTVSSTSCAWVEKRKPSFRKLIRWWESVLGPLLLYGSIFAWLMFSPETPLCHPNHGSRTDTCPLSHLSARWPFPREARYATWISRMPSAGLPHAARLLLRKVPVMVCRFPKGGCCLLWFTLWDSILLD